MGYHGFPPQVGQQWHRDSLHVCPTLLLASCAGAQRRHSIHQPSAELFQQFDRLLLLKKGGQTVYFGDLGENAGTLINYFENNGGRKIEPKENPAEYMLEVIGAGATANSDVEWAGAWRESPEARRVAEEIEQIHAEGRKQPPVEGTMPYSTLLTCSRLTSYLVSLHSVKVCDVLGVSGHGSP